MFFLIAENGKKLCQKEEPGIHTGLGKRAESGVGKKCPNIDVKG
jgi:hypothetical protein